MWPLVVRLQLSDITSRRLGWAGPICFVVLCFCLREDENYPSQPGAQARHMRGAEPPSGPTDTWMRKKCLPHATETLWLL